MTRSRSLKLLLLTLLSMSVAGCFSLQKGSFSPPTAAEVGPVLNNYGEAVIPAHGVIVVRGDDLIYGDDPKARRLGINGSAVHRLPMTITETLRRVLHPVGVVNQGYPGDTAAMGEARWADEPVGNLLIISYGYGDAFARTPVAAYHKSLVQMVRQAHAQGAAVFLLATPALSAPSPTLVVNPAAPTPAQNGRRGTADIPPADASSAAAPMSTGEFNSLLAAYRVEMHKVGAEENAEVFEPQTQLTQFKLTAARTVVQPEVIDRVIAGGLVAYIKLVPDPTPNHRRGKPDPGQP